MNEVLMSLYFRKSVKIAPGLHVNFSKRGMGMSVGKRGGPRLTLGPTGRVTASQSFGGGLRYQKSLSLKKSATPHISPAYLTADATSAGAPEHHDFWASFLFWGIGSLLFGGYLQSHHPSNNTPSIICFLFGAIFFVAFLVDFSEKGNNPATIATQTSEIPPHPELTEAVDQLIAKFGHAAVASEVTKKQ